jgi:CRISPR system Cascade subunit CasD
VRWLLFDIAAPLASFGGPAPGSVRDTDTMPSRGALLGLFAAALGFRRDDTAGHARLSTALRFAVRVRRAANAGVLRDYHTAQAPKQSALKGRPHRTRSDELAVPKWELSTVLSDRYYLMDFFATVGVVAEESILTLDSLAQALHEPIFTLYVGRKACPPQWPMNPIIVEKADWFAALQERDQHHALQAARFRDAQQAQVREPGRIEFLPGHRGSASHAWDASLNQHEALPVSAQQRLRMVHRRDQPTDRMKWLYADRVECRIDHIEDVA